MGAFVGVMVAIYVIPGLIAHIKRHIWNYEKRVIVYDEERVVLSISQLNLLMSGEKFYFRKDGSLWKREDIKYGKVVKESYQLYYPSGNSKFQSFTNSDIS